MAADSNTVDPADRRHRSRHARNTEGVNDRKPSTASRWKTIAGQVRQELPGEWSLRGSGQQLCVVREPVEWTFEWFGFEGTRAGGVIQLTAGVQPLIATGTFFHRSYGMRMDEVRGGPKSLDVHADDAVDIAVGFFSGAGLEVVDQWSAERLAELAERSLERLTGLGDPATCELSSAEVRSRTGGYWPMCPGWRAVQADGSSGEAAETVIAWMERSSGGGSTDPDTAGRRTYAMTFYRAIREAWGAGGRGAALAVLDLHRAATMRAAGVDRRLDRP